MNEEKQKDSIEIPVFDSPLFHMSLSGTTLLVILLIIGFGVAYAIAIAGGTLGAYLLILAPVALILSVILKIFLGAKTVTIEHDMLVVQYYYFNKRNYKKDLADCLSYFTYSYHGYTRTSSSINVEYGLVMNFGKQGMLNFRLRDQLSTEFIAKMNMLKIPSCDPDNADRLIFSPAIAGIITRRLSKKQRATQRKL